MTLNLSPDTLLTTTRSVRRRLDLQRPVEMSIIRDCLEIAIQAPSGSNAQGWHFVVVTDTAKKQALADLYRRAWALYIAQPRNSNPAQRTSPSARASQERVASSAGYLAEHYHEVPLMLIPCISGRFENNSALGMASAYGSILPATWSFMLAARARGLAACWTTLHLMFEEEAAGILGIPFTTVTQVALLPVAYALGNEFKPALRKPLDELLHIDQW